jgi:beta-phosphoglucomutase family hydrolase
VLGLPEGVVACLFDLDGVLTETAIVHADAWKVMFDEFLAAQPGNQRPFDISADYGRYVDGKPRAAGVRDFLASRGIHLPEGGDDDPPSAETVHGLGNRKNILVLEKIHNEGVAPYPGSVRYLHAARDAGLRRAVVSSSANCADVVRAAGIEDLLEVRVDGETAIERHLAGKPAPDTFLAAAEMLGVPVGASAVFEDALAGVEAGRAGAFGAVVGVDRLGHAAALKQHGATVVVQDLAELLTPAEPGEGGQAAGNPGAPR